MRFTFRADASSAIGFGHFSRVLSLAGAASRAGAEVALATARPDSTARAIGARAKLAVEEIDAEPGTIADALATRAIAGAEAIVVVDGYAFRDDYLRALGGERRLVAYVDDLVRERLTCDVIVNPNVSGLAAEYDTAPATTLLVGPSFAIVHYRFSDARRARSEARGVQPRAPERLLVTMGGSDPPGATLNVIDALTLVDGPALQVRVVVGAANQRAEDVRRAAAACTRHRVELRSSVEDMAAEMLWAELVVTASGVTASEIACVGVPGLSFAIVDNQEIIAQHLAALEMFDILPPGGGGPAAIAGALSLLAADHSRRTKLVEQQRSVIDGAGKDRVVARLLALQQRERHTGQNGGASG